MTPVVPLIQHNGTTSSNVYFLFAAIMTSCTIKATHGRTDSTTSKKTPDATSEVLQSVHHAAQSRWGCRRWVWVWDWGRGAATPPPPPKLKHTKKDKKKGKNNSKMTKKTKESDPGRVRGAEGGEGEREGGVCWTFCPFGSFCTDFKSKGSFSF